MKVNSIVIQLNKSKMIIEIDNTFTDLIEQIDNNINIKVNKVNASIDGLLHEDEIHLSSDTDIRVATANYSDGQYVTIVNTKQAQITFGNEKLIDIRIKIPIINKLDGIIIDGIEQSLSTKIKEWILFIGNTKDMLHYENISVTKGVKEDIIALLSVAVGLKE